MRLSLRFTGWLALLLVISLAACGTMNVTSLDPTQAGRHQVTGVKLGGFEVIRHDAQGYLSSSLNSTLNLRLDETGGEHALVIGVNDASFTNAVTMELRYDAKAVHPDRAEFHGLLGNSSQVISLAVLDKVAGIAGVGEACIGDYRPLRLKGDFATVYFADGPSTATRTASIAPWPIAGVGAIVGGVGNFIGTSDGSSTATATWYAGWTTWDTGDGSQDGQVNLADITPIAVQFGKSWQTGTIVWSALKGDYDTNGTVTLGDLPRIAQHFNETCTQYIVEIGDNDAAATNVSTFGSPILWTAGTLPIPPDPGTAGDLSTAFRSWSVTFTGADFATLGGKDANADGNVRITVFGEDNASPPNDGAKAFVDVNVTPPTQNDKIQVTDFEIKAAGATGGGGTGDIFSGRTGGDSSGSVASNATVTFTLDGIYGAYTPFGGGAVQFTPATTFPTAEGMTQADYDAALDGARGLIAWSFANGGVAWNAGDFNAGSRSTGDWAFKTGGIPALGDPGAVTVFPDNDPEATGATAEGRVSLALPTGDVAGIDPLLELDVTVPAATAYNNMTFDVTSDPVAVLINEYTDAPVGGNPVTELTTVVSSAVFVDFDWGSGGVPADLSTTDLELLRINTSGGNEGTVAEVIPFTWTNTKTPNPGEFHIELVALNWVFQIGVPGGSLQLGAYYVFRYNNATVWTTINVPTAMLATATPPPPTGLITTPHDLGPSNDYMEVYYPDPVVRRDGRLNIDPLSGTCDPIDSIGYADTLKTNGDEFPISVSGFEAWPVVAIKEYAGPAAPNPGDYPVDRTDTVAGIGVFERSKGRIALNVAIITPPGSVGDPEKYYAFRFFNPDTSVCGFGWFIVSPVDVTPPQVVGVNWGVNAWNRENLTIGSESYTNWTVNGDTMVLNTPDVMWIKFGGGPNWDWNEYWNDTDPWDPPTNDNVMIVLEDTDGVSGTAIMKCLVSIAGVDTQKNYITIHHFNLIDNGPGGTGEYWDWDSTVPGMPGILIPTHSYYVHLDDPTTGGYEWTSPNNLDCVGTNPNGP